MIEISKKRREELRGEVDRWEFTKATVMPTLCCEIRGLLDMADERDRLLDKIEDIQWQARVDEALNGSQS